MWWEEKWIQISEVPWTKFGQPGGVGVAVGPRPANGLGLCPPISGLGIGLSSFSVTSDPHWCSLTTTRRGLRAAPTHRPQHDSAYLSFQLSPRGWLSAFSTSLSRGPMPCPPPLLLLLLLLLLLILLLPPPLLVSFSNLSDGQNTGSVISCIYYLLASVSAV